MVNPLHVLVVEDNPVNQKLLGLMLKQFGYTSVMAANGKIGLDEYRKGGFDVILMDIQMPVMDGLFHFSIKMETRRQWMGLAH